MTNKTPIEKAAEDCAKHLLSREPNETYIKEIAEAFASIIRRRLEKEVPEKPESPDSFKNILAASYNKARRDIGLRDEGN